MRPFQTFEELELARRSFVFDALASGAALLTACQSSTSTKLMRLNENERALDQLEKPRIPRCISYAEYEARRARG
jgi:hypothetical protein